MTSSDWKTISTAAKFLSAALLLLLCTGPLYADNGDLREKTAEDMENYRFKNVTTPEGLHFTVPEDMPIVTRNGLKGPVPMEEYQYYKLRKLEEKVVEVDKKLDRLEVNLLRSLAAIEKQLAALAAGKEKPVEAEAAPQT